MTEFAAGRWRGQWIWSDRTAHLQSEDAFHIDLDPDYYDRRVLFRRTFELAEIPATAPFRITADSRYILYVNGIEILRGPLRHGPRQLRYDHGDLRHALRPGLNVVAVHARFFGRHNAWWAPSPATLTLGGGSLVAEVRVGQEWIGTDEQWRYHDTTAWTPSLPIDTVSAQLIEVFDATKLDPAWITPEFDDGDWKPAKVLRDYSHGGSADGRPPSEPFGSILPSPLPHPIPTPVPAESVRTAPISWTPGEPGGITLALAAAAETAQPEAEERDLDLSAGPRLVVADFGQIVAGHVYLQLHTSGNITVDGALTELTTEKGLRHAASFRYVARDGDNEFVREDPCGGRFLVLALYGTGTARLETVEVVERNRPRPDGPAFAASDSDLDRIYAVGVRTVDLTAQDAYLDCPTREQRAWTGDSVVHQSVDLVANPDWSLPRWNPQLCAAPRSDGMLPMVGVGDFADPAFVAIPDWALHWIRALHNLYRYTGDRALVADLMPAAEQTLRFFSGFAGPDGLVHDVTGWVLIDWAPVPVHGTSASLNALWGRALLDFAELADWLGDGSRAVRSRAEHAALKRGFEAFWDAGRGAYREQLRDGAAVTEHAHAAAVCARLVPDERLQRVEDLLLDRDAMISRAMFLQPTGAHGILPSPESPDWDTERLVVAAQPYFRYVVHDALAQLGAADRIGELVRDWLPLLESGPTAWREVWEGGSYAHGWSSTPTRDLITYTLGVTPGEPGYGTVRVAPRLGALEWVTGTVPTPHGPVTVEVRGNRVSVTSPVPVELVARDGSAVRHPAGSVSGEI
ncbi:MAG TPA: alpha-L-rhamnosidase C-terminal domain-containing protein [Mycobacteriales bacterium]|nr:alpha-L-rhamnosidase C-terminal domain-containing protein [Mycobacteriales bacterium]